MFHVAPYIKSREKQIEDINNEKILVVDDEPFLLMIVEDKLKKAGYDVLTQRTSKPRYEDLRPSNGKAHTGH